MTSCFCVTLFILINYSMKLNLTFEQKIQGFAVLVIGIAGLVNYLI